MRGRAEGKRVREGKVKETLVEGAAVEGDERG